MSATPSPSRLLIVGAGLAGSLMAVLLAKDGHHVTLCERRPDPRRRGFLGGRSINLALSARGIHGLAAAGLAERVCADAIPMRGRMLHSPTGEIAFQPYSGDPKDAINSVSRSGLNLTLLEAAAEQPNVRMFFDHRCTDVDLAAPAATFIDSETGEHVRMQADAVIGADGAFSAVRGKMQIQDRFNYAQDYLEHGYKELHIPPSGGGGGGGDGAHAMETNALHIWPRGGSMMIALPNPDGSFTCTLFWPYEGPHGFAAIRTRNDIIPFFEKHYPDAVPLMPTLVEDYERNPIGSLVTVRCSPWRIGNTVLIGDAAHAIVPFFGQGMNAAFEDCVALRDGLRAHGADFAAAFTAFETTRKHNAEAIADMALENFIEMRDKVASPLFRLKKRAGHALHKLFPRSFTPLYNMVSFTTIPYAEARERARRQSQAIKNIAVILGVLFILIVALILA